MFYSAFSFNICLEFHVLCNFSNPPSVLPQVNLIYYVGEVAKEESIPFHNNLSPDAIHNFRTTLLCCQHYNDRINQRCRDQRASIGTQRTTARLPIVRSRRFIYHPSLAFAYIFGAGNWVLLVRSNSSDREPLSYSVMGVYTYISICFGPSV